MGLVALAAAAASWCLLLTVYALAVLQISPKSKLRYVAAAALAGFAYSFHINWNSYMENRSIATTLTVISWVFCLSACELLVCSQVGIGDLHRSPRIHRGEKDDKPSITVSGRLSCAIGLLFNLRRVGTRWAVKNTPVFKHGIPSRSEFIQQKLWRVIVLYLIVDCLTSGVPPEDLVDLHHQKLLSRRSEVSKGELIFRASSVAVFWVTTALLNMMMTDAGVLILVVTKATTPDQCPPINNSFGHAWSVRQFWGVSWHQCLRKGITGVGDLVVDSVFSRTHRISTYSRLIMAFAMSGLLHHAGDMAMGIPFGEGGAFLFFVYQAFGIIFEDAVQGVYRHSGIKLPRVVERTIGYLWVGLFLFWTTPSWMYPCARYTFPPRDSLVPYRVFGTIVKTFA